QAQCKTEYGNCITDTNCRTLMNCMVAYTDTTCVDNCVTPYGPATFALVDAMLGDTGCSSTRCGTYCSTPTGLGDPCTLDSDCGGGGICEHAAGEPGWCSESCSTANSTCLGSATNGYNQFGNFNWCIPSTTLGSICFPGCTTDDECRTNYGDPTLV